MSTTPSVALVSSPPPIAEDLFDASAPPPFSLGDIRNSIVQEMPDAFERKTFTSMVYAIRDMALVTLFSASVLAVNTWWAWPLYWAAQGTMFWALFVIGHDCGHQSFSKHEWVNHLVGHITHSFIGVPYHPWRISHRKHHNNHGHVGNDESWYPMTRQQYEEANAVQRAGRTSLPWALFAYPFYLMNRSPGKDGSHYDPQCDLFKTEKERKMVMRSNMWLTGMAGLLAAASATFGLGLVFKLWFVPYVTFVVWLDAVTYLHHHGPEEGDPLVPWYRGEEWNYMRGGISTIDRDYGFINHIHHDIGTHVMHHLFPTMPHYHLCEATEGGKKVMGEYYREPKRCENVLGLPFHLLKPLIKSFKEDKFVENEGDVLYYKAN